MRFQLARKAFIIQDNAVIGNIFNAVGFHYRITAANALLWIRLGFSRACEICFTVIWVLVAAPCFLKASDNTAKNF